MEFEETGFSGLYIIKPKVHADQRGFFMEAYSARLFDKAGLRDQFVQDNQSSSIRGVLRGLHFQRPPHSQTKLVRVLSGEIIDIVLDLRRDEPTFGRLFTGVLSAFNKQQLLIPKGFAHGFAVLSETADVLYKCDEYYYPETEGGINILDPSLKVRSLIPNAEYILSEKDSRLPVMVEAKFDFRKGS